MRTTVTKQGDRWVVRVGGEVRAVQKYWGVALASANRHAAMNRKETR